PARAGRRSARGPSAAPRQAEQALGDDVLLDLGRTPVDRSSAAVEVEAVPFRRVGVTACERRMGAARVQRGLRDALLDAPEDDLVDRALRAGLTAGDQPPDAPVALVLEDLELDVGAGQRSSDAGRLDHRTTVADRRPRLLDRAVQGDAQHD